MICLFTNVNISNKQQRDSNLVDTWLILLRSRSGITGFDHVTNQVHIPVHCLTWCLLLNKCILYIKLNHIIECRILHVIWYNSVSYFYAIFFYQLILYMPFNIYMIKHLIVIFKIPYSIWIKWNGIAFSCIIISYCRIFKLWFRWLSLFIIFLGDAFFEVSSIIFDYFYHYCRFMKELSLFSMTYAMN